MNINDIALEDIDKEMPFYDFIGKTIEKIMWEPMAINIQFTDGTTGNIFISQGFSSTEEHLEWVKGVKEMRSGYPHIIGGVMPTYNDLLC